METNRPNSHYRAFRQDGDLDALARLFDETAPKLLALARRLGSERGEAEDWVQETFLRVLEKPEALPADGDVVPWLLGTLVNRARQERRKAARQPDPERLLQREVEAPDRGLSAAEVRAAIEAAIEDLPPAQRRAVAGKLLDGRSTDELGAELRVAPSAIRARIHRGLARLRAVLPLGLATGLLAWLFPTRGLAGVRARVLERAARGAFASGAKVTVVGTAGIMMLKKIAAVGVVGAVTWFLYMGSSGALAPEQGPLVEAAIVESELVAGEPATGGLLAQGDAAAPSRTAAATLEPEASGASEFGTLRVRILNEDGDAVVKASAQVRYMDFDPERNPEQLPSAATDSRGWAVLEISPGREFLLTALKLLESSREQVEVAGLDPGEVRELTIHVVTGDDETFTGRVLRADGNLPIAGVSVHLNYLSGGLSTGGERLLNRDEVPAAVTDVDGLFTVRGRSWAAPVACFSGLGWSLKQVLLGPSATSGRVLEVRLRRGARISGMIRGAEGSGFTVKASTPAHGLAEGSDAFKIGGGDVLFEAQVDASGRFDLGGLPSRAPLSLRVVSGGTTRLQFSDRLALEPDEVREVDWSIGAAGAIRGRVVGVNGEPEVGIEVWLLSSETARPGLLENYYRPTARTKSDALGRFVFSEVPPGTWIVGLAPVRRRGPAQADAYAPIAVAAHVPEDGSGADVELNLYRGLFVEGVLKDPDGDAVPRHSYVHMYSLEAKMFLTANCEEDGSFRAGPLPAGEYQLTGESNSNAGLASSKALAVSAGDTGIEVFLRPGSELSGRVAGLTLGQSETGWMIVKRRNGSARMARLDEQHSFLFSGLLEGTYELSFASQDGRVGHIAGIALGTGEQITDLQMQLEPGGTLLVYYKGSKPTAPLSILQDGVVFFTDGIHSGTQKRAVVPAGEVEVVLGEERRQVFISVGEETTIRFEESD